MNVVDFKQIKFKLSLSTPIGIGTTAICFKTIDNEVIKIYYDNFFRNYMNNKIELLTKFGDDTFVAPSKAIIKKDKFIGYIYPFVNGFTLNKARRRFTLNQYIDNYPYLVKKTRTLSGNKFVLSDLHARNIIFNGTFHIIDMDRGYIKEEYSEDRVFNRNILGINKNIINSIFNVHDDEILEFENPTLQKLYIISIYRDYSEIFSLFDEFKKINEDDKAINLGKKVNIIKQYNSYYKY